jgi:hypothetical protein
MYLRNVSTIAHNHAVKQLKKVINIKDMQYKLLSNILGAFRYFACEINDWDGHGFAPMATPPYSRQGAKGQRLIRPHPQNTFASSC